MKLVIIGTFLLLCVNSYVEDDFAKYKKIQWGSK